SRMRPSDSGAAYASSASRAAGGGSTPNSSPTLARKRRRCASSSTGAPSTTRIVSNTPAARSGRGRWVTRGLCHPAAVEEPADRQRRLLHLQPLPAAGGGQRRG